jgi:hypothetical protein
VNLTARQATPLFRSVLYRPLLLFQIFDEGIDSLDRHAVQPFSGKLAVALDPYLEFIAFFAHGSPRIGRERAALSVTERYRGGIDDTLNDIPYDRFRTHLSFGHLSFLNGRRGADRSRVRRHGRQLIAWPVLLQLRRPGRPAPLHA